jgi:hypothetical protein
MPQEDRLMIAKRRFIDIPDELILLIADHLPLESLLRLRTMNKQLWTLLTPKINECVKKCLPQQIVAGGGHTLALTEAGALYAWGYNKCGQLGIGSTVQQNVPVIILKFAVLAKISSDGIANAYRFFNPKADSPAHPAEGGAALPLPKRAMECTVL